MKQEGYIHFSPEKTTRSSESADVEIVIDEKKTTHQIAFVIALNVFNFILIPHQSGSRPQHEK